MKHLILIMIALLVVPAVVFAQLQPLPTPATGGVQGTKAAMMKGNHDFTVDSGKVITSIDSSVTPWDTTYHPVGASTSLCGYCHAAHVPATGIARPLWVRASVTDRTFGDPYSNPNSLDATVEPVENSDNYSSFCLSCHDGSAMFTATAYTEGKRPRAASGKNWADYENATVGHEANVVSGEFNLEHIHPVNFDYNAARALDPVGLYAAQTATYVWSGPNGGTPNQTTSIRLFDGYMQCSTCHNPHMRTGIGLVYSSAYGKLCVSCHAK
jgi:predicted CXXCH cytochrome family protein